MGIGNVRTLSYVSVAISLVTLTACWNGFKPASPISSSSSQSIIPAPTPTPTPMPTSQYPVVDVLAGYGGVRVYSTDGGHNWKYTSDGVLNSDCWMYRDMAYGNGLFVGVSGTGGYGRVSTSPDGVHWREFESHIGAGGIVYGGGKFVSESFTSTDGYNFNYRYPNVDVGGHAKVGYIKGNYILAGDKNGIAISSDGDNFTMTLANYVSAPTSHIVQFAVGNGIIVGLANTRVVASSDGGQTWTDHDDFFGLGTKTPTGPDDYNSFFSINFDGTQFVIYGRGAPFGSTPMTWKSADGVNWTMAPATGRVYFAGGLPSSHLIGLGNDVLDAPGYIMSSSDLGTTWTPAMPITLSPYYEFSTPAALVANPPVTDFSGWYIQKITSGQASSDPNITPNLPPNVLFSHDELLTSCGPDLPPGR